MSRVPESSTCFDTTLAGIDSASRDATTTAEVLMGTPGTSRASWHRGHLTSVPCRRGITDSRAPHGQVKGILVGLGESCMVQSRFCVGLLRNHHHHRVVCTASPLGTVATNSAKLPRTIMRFAKSRQDETYRGDFNSRV